MSELTIIRDTGEMLQIDVVGEVSVNRSVLLPSHPIDPGSGRGTVELVNDSAVLEPLDFSVTCTLSDYAPAGALADPRRAEAAVEFLESIVGVFVTVVLPKHKAVKDCQIAAFPYTISRVRARPFQLVFRRTGFASRSTVVLARIVDRAKPDLPKPVDIGEQTVKVATPEKATPVRTSLAKRIGGSDFVQDKILGAFGGN